jgi:hypothetical protein
MRAAPYTATVVLGLTVGACGSQQHRVGSAPALPAGKPLAALDMPARPFDLLPERARATVLEAPAQVTAGGRISVASARLLLSSAAYPAWVLDDPPGAVCLLATVSEGVRNAVGYDLSCAPVTRARAGWLMLSSAGAPGERGTRVEGLVPDHVSSVLLRARGRPPLRVAVRTNSYSARLVAPESVAFSASGALHTVPFPGAPGRG